MQLGKTLVGAVIGAVVGIGILLAAYLLARQQGMWLAIPVAIATGLGVRSMVSTRGHASIVRGAITLALALVAYFVGWIVVAWVANNRATAAPSRPIADAKADASAEGATKEGDDAADGEGSAEAAPPEPKAVPAAPHMAASKGLPRATPSNSPLDFVWLGIAALVAYELGRGTGKAAPGAAGAEDANDAAPNPDGIRTPD